jgi:ABC-2 type transport system ATP-binding protein
MRPDVLILDEPTAGLDPQTRANMWDYVARLQQQNGITIFLTTHNMEEAEIAQQVAVIDHGKLVAFDTPSKLKTMYTSTAVRLTTTQPVALADYLQRRSLPYTTENDCFTIYPEQLSGTLELVCAFRDSITDLEISKGSLNDVFLAITGREVRN